MFAWMKDPRTLHGEAVQCEEVPCSCGKVYIGETKRRLETRIKEHMQGCMHEAFHRQVSHRGAHLDSESSHQLEQGKSAGPCMARATEPVFVGGTVHLDQMTFESNWLNLVGWRLWRAGLLDHYHMEKQHGEGTGIGVIPRSTSGHVYRMCGYKCMHVSETIQPEETPWASRIEWARGAACEPEELP